MREGDKNQQRLGEKEKRGSRSRRLVTTMKRENKEQRGKGNELQERIRGKSNHKIGEKLTVLQERNK